MDKKYLIIITGKSGVGKSIFSDYLSQELDALLINLDKISHLSLEDDFIKQKLKDKFGEEIFEKNAILRKKLGNIVFKDANKLEFLNNLSQEFMENYIDKLIQNTDKKYIILEYALITKMKYYNHGDYKILISADKLTRFERLKIRDGVSEDYLNLRESNLPDFDETKFDEIIHNTSSKSDDLIELSKKIAKKIQTSTICKNT